MDYERQKSFIHYEKGYIYYLERKYLETDLYKKVQSLENRLNRAKKKKDSESIKRTNELLEPLTVRRPCLILNSIGKNVILLPITTSQISKYNISIDPLQINPEYQRESFVKISNIVTIDSETFTRINIKPTPGIRDKLTDKELNLIQSKVKEHLFK